MLGRLVLVTLNDLANTIADLVHRMNASMVIAPETKLICNAIVPDKINAAITSRELQIVTVNANDLLHHIDIGRSGNISE